MSGGNAPEIPSSSVHAALHPQSSNLSQAPVTMDESIEAHGEISESEATVGPHSVSRSSSVASTAPGTILYHVYKLSSYVVLKTEQIVLQMVQLSWRFFELHLHKMSMLVLFVVALSEISAGYWVLLAISLFSIPLPYFSPVLYPLLTIYIGVISVVKTIYQFPVLHPDKFNLTSFNSSDDQCSELLNITSYLGNYSGSVFNNRYSSRVNDGGWFGLHKVSDYAEYIVGPLCLSLLLSMHFSVKRHQISFSQSRKTVVDSWEQGSLFLNVSQPKAETSILAACKYLFNHLFEMYGIEVTLVMMAVAVAVRVDVYGVLYCLLLGLLLILPRGLMAPVWLLYTVIYGLLLILQYSMLLGVPPGVCFYPNGYRRYPWDRISGNDATNFGLKKWLFLSDFPQMLDKTVLYVDFLVYMLLCLQLYNFKTPKEVCEPLDFLRIESLMSYLKVFLTKYYFWVSIFLVFFAAISRVSFFGFVYLLLCFVLLYRGQNMLMDRKSRRIKSWAGLRLLAWTILLIRVSVQIADCVFYNDLAKKTQCNFILVFNGGCNRERFYACLLSSVSTVSS
jgi:hypothetical protein